MQGVRVASVNVTLDGQAQFVAIDQLFKELLSTSEPALVCGDMNTFRDVDYILASPAASTNVVQDTGAVYTAERFGGHAQIAIDFDFGD